MTILSIDVGGTKVSGILSNGPNKLTDRFVEPTPKTKNELIDLLIKKIAKANKKIDGGLVGVGIGVAGLCDHKDGFVVSSPNLPLTGVPLGEILQNKSGSRVFIDNDANMAALGERAVGEGHGLNDFIFLTLGTGIGGGIFIDGELYRGSLGAAAEIGHMVISANGPRCNCGRLGCLESMASGTAVTRMAEDVVLRTPRAKLSLLAGGKPNVITSKDVGSLARDGDPESIEIFRMIGQSLGIGLGNLINIFSPEAIVLGGGLSGAADLFLSTAINVMLRTSIDPRASEVKIKSSKLKNDAGLLGAVEMVRLEL